MTMSSSTSLIKRAIRLRQKANKPVVVSFITAGYPNKDATVDILMSLGRHGASVIELGMPFSDSASDGPVIRYANEIALKNKVGVSDCMDIIKSARGRGLDTPIVLMGYYNTILATGQEEFVNQALKAGANGCIVCDLPIEESQQFRQICKSSHFSYIPLVAPSTPVSRMKSICEAADGFIYVVSRMSVTGVTNSNPITDSVRTLCNNVRKYANDTPICVGFGISDKLGVELSAQVADGAIIGSKLIDIIKHSEKGSEAEHIGSFLESVTDFEVKYPDHSTTINNNTTVQEEEEGGKLSEFRLPPRFGKFGGQYVAESLRIALDQMEEAFVQIKDDEKFWEDLRSYYPYMGRPSTLYYANQLSDYCGGAKIFLKREDLNHTGSHKINNAIGQALLAKRLGKTHLITETGAGQNGVAVATVAAKLGMKCTVYMGAEDCERQKLNVFRINLLGGEVIPVHDGSKTLKDAATAALRAWVEILDTAHYVVGSAIGPHPFPTVVRHFQSVIGNEARKQFIGQFGKLPDAITSCVGGGSNCSGSFHAFVNDENVKLVGYEAAGQGIDTPFHGASLSRGTPGVLNGSYSMILQDSDGQIIESSSISAGLDYPGVGPELAYWKSIGRAQFEAITDKEALQGFLCLAKYEGILAALETSHAIYGTMQLARTMSPDQSIILCLSGRGDKDVETIYNKLSEHGLSVN